MSEAILLRNDGYIILPDFLSHKEIDEMKQGCWDIVDKMDINEHCNVFVGGDDQICNDYFVKSCDKIAFFFEDGVFDETGNLIVDKHSSFNKIAHALHFLSIPFRRYTFSDKVKNLMRMIGYVEPVVFQSMCIFKPPHIGGLVLPHQDLTYLYVNTEKLMGFWFALEDADIDNSCLHFIPGSHKNGLHNGRRFMKDANDPDGHVMMHTAQSPQYDDSSFVPVPVKKGYSPQMSEHSHHCIQLVLKCEKQKRSQLCRPNLSNPITYSFFMHRISAGTADNFDNC